MARGSDARERSGDGTGGIGRPPEAGVWRWGLEVGFWRFGGGILEVWGWVLMVWGGFWRR